MSVLSVKNIQEVFIGKSLDRTANVQISDPSNATTYIADGEIVLLDDNGAIGTTTNMANVGTSPWFQIVQRSGDQLIFSSRIYGGNVTAYRGTSAGTPSSADKEQVYEVGYTGSAGSIDVSVGTDYMFSLMFKHDDQMYSEQLQKYAVTVPSNEGTTQLAVAKSVAKQLSFAYAKNSIPVTTTMLNSGTAATIGAVTLSVAHQSNVITYSGTATGVVAGSLIRIGATGTAIGTAIPVYTVKEAHPTIANAFILDQYYMGPTNSALPNADHGLIATPGTAYGIRVTGKPLDFVKDFFKFKKVMFSIGLTGFGTTAVNRRQEAAFCQGDGRLVAEEESFCKGFQGALNRMTVPLPSINVDAVSTTTSAPDTTLGGELKYASTAYDCITIQHFSKNDGVTHANPAMPQTVKIFLVNGALQQSTATSGVRTVLDTYMPTTPLALPALGAI